MVNRRTGMTGEEKTAWLLMAPFLLLFAVFKLYPLLYGFSMSFFDRNSIKTISDSTFVWFKNYASVFSDSTTMGAFGRTVEFSLIQTLLTMTCALATALMLNKKFKGRAAVRTMFYMPYVTNLIAIGVVWNYILNPYKGPVNRILMALGVAQEQLPLWLSGNSSALPVTAAINTWVGLAFPVITILAALQEIPITYHEVADLEGATGWQRFRFIILPLLKPTLLFVLTITLIYSFKNYTVIMALTQGGPGLATNVVSMQIYADAFTYYRFGIASAESMLLTALIFLVNLLVRKVKTNAEIF